ncbi:MAG: glutathione S-transferase family protein [Glaciecola sp.]
MQLFGSTTSPYVRRLRIFMQEIEHDFVLVDIFNSRDRASIAADNPTLKIPMLKHEQQVILDSGVIYRYLTQKFGLTSLTWEQENLLTSIDSVNESLVQLLILSRSEIDVSADKLYFRIQRERIDVVLSHLEKQAEQGAFEQWDYVSISLFCLIDWVLFRNLHDVSGFTTLNALHTKWKQLAICHQTAPN